MQDAAQTGLSNEHTSLKQEYYNKVTNGNKGIS